MSEWNIITGFFIGMRFSAFLISIILFPAQRRDRISVNFRNEAFHAVFICPFSGSEASFNKYLPSLFQLGCIIGKLAPTDNSKPVYAILEISITASPTVICG